MKVELHGVTKRFGGQTVLNRITSTIEFPHTLALIGPSGGGKSTFLRLLAGLIAPDAGTITIDGEPIPGESPALRRYRARIGIVFQAFNLFPHLSALDNIRLALTEVHGLSPSMATTRAMDALARFQLADHAHKRPATLSGGQRQRVAIARAIAIQPKFLLFDEPTSSLDPEMTAEVLELLATLRSENRTMILVTHEMGFARHTADLVAFISGGSIEEVDAPERIFGEAKNPTVRNFLARVLRY
ncbi:MAG: amino acid ABC transporter ATP-binding protein [Terrimicrobiaceae bacterium]|nr:amino acid ABC transporter ATP-binding protein [Terrimicrobiaceae bacterium]